MKTFCWIYNNVNKVFSITKDGPRCSQLYLGDFANNNSTLVNKIDVKDRLIKYQEAFENLRQGVSNATDFDSLKVYPVRINKRLISWPHFSFQIQPLIQLLLIL